MLSASVGIQAKIDRAKEHTELFGKQFDALIEENNKVIIGPTQLYPETGIYVSRVGEFRPDLTPCSVIAGEIYYQLRSALEHMAWGLVKAAHARPKTGLRGDKPATTFPIYMTEPADFVKAVAKRELQGARHRAIKAIEDFQPYKAADPKTHSLAVIKALADVDKHRTVLLAAINAVDPSQFRALYRFDPPTALKSFRRNLKPGQRLKPGTKIATFCFADKATPHVYVDGKLTVNVRISDGEPSSVAVGSSGGSAVEDSIAEVASVFAAIKPFL